MARFTRFLPSFQVAHILNHKSYTAPAPSSLLVGANGKSHDVALLYMKDPIFFIKDKGGEDSNTIKRPKDAAVGRARRGLLFLL